MINVKLTGLIVLLLAIKLDPERHAIFNKKARDRRKANKVEQLEHDDMQQITTATGATVH